MNFHNLKVAVAAKFEQLQKNHQLFRVKLLDGENKVDNDILWNTYINSFPAGTNPVFRERTEHDCSCCKQFIRAVGNVVAIVDNKLMSIWDVTVKDEPAYQAVVDALSAKVKSFEVGDFFLHYENKAGQDKTFEQLTDGIKTWNHFHVNINRQYVMANSAIATALSEHRSLRDVLYRSLSEITDDAVETTLELIAQNSLYRGEEHKFVVTEFRKLQKQFRKLGSESEKKLFAWTLVKTLPASVSRIRNTSIGTLLVDLSEGLDLEVAVKKFEVVMAPANYKRPTALVTQAMVTKAKEKLQELGLTSALERRFAKLSDITVNNILFANRDAKRAITNDVFDDLAAGIPTKVKNLDKVEDVTIENFINNILPRAESIEIMVENRHSGNFMSLITAVDPSAGQMFKWDNRFSWAYNGEAADSIKERVKAAGGSITGDLCCRLAWDYDDDLDFHMSEPGGHKIYFGNKRSTSPCGGMLDVDANGGDGTRPNPVENIYYADRKKMKDGVYTLSVNNWRRCTAGVGFTVEIEFDGQILSIGYDKVISQGKYIQVAKIEYTKAGGFKVLESLPSSQTSREVWGLTTQTFQKVNVMMMSPNHWDDKAVGNKHYFFMIDGCKNEGTPRGFFNEFLSEELTKHRKVLEIVGSKMKVAESDEQLSGLGFSTTQKNSILCRVKGAFTRTINIVF